jgi:hypothetical protein
MSALVNLCFYRKVSPAAGNEYFWRTVLYSHQKEAFFGFTINSTVRFL